MGTTGRSQPPLDVIEGLRQGPPPVSERKADAPQDRKDRKAPDGNETVSEPELGLKRTNAQFEFPEAFQGVEPEKNWLLIVLLNSLMWLGGDADMVEYSDSLKIAKEMFWYCPRKLTERLSWPCAEEGVVKFTVRRPPGGRVRMTPDGRRPTVHSAPEEAE